MTCKQPYAGLCAGSNKGHLVTDLAPRPSDLSHLLKSLIREVATHALYKKRTTEQLKVGEDKHALKVAKQELGTHKRAKKKREEMTTVLREMGSA
ncbi:hypothetical protein RJ640_023058 [Escallonia rubra]|uniref:60S ribosomal protein L36 n=1 Tax=Escallonia rubra TaxID=112253 RepID=A0AA88R6C3_9ASTE|nr:hypothetical protein RJ640_023058 [Escallonia rubra]